MTSENGQDLVSSLNEPMSGMRLEPAELKPEQMNAAGRREHLDGIEKTIELPETSINDLKNISGPNDDREYIVLWILEKMGKKEVFHLHISGPAGTGKSALLSKLVENVELKFGEKSCLVIAPTGVAAVNVDGSTIHSALKLNPFATNYSMDENPIFNTSMLVPQSTKIIILDEISMVDSIILGRLDKRLKAQKYLKTIEPFGGLPVIAFGDLLQLEPVNTNKNTPTPFVFLEIPRTSAFYIEGLKLWENFRFAELKNNMRTRNEEESKMLQNIRTGEEKSSYEKFLKDRGCLMELDELNCESEKAYREYKKIKEENPNKQFLIVTATNKIVDRVNEMALLELEPDTKAYRVIKADAYSSSQLIPHKTFARELEKTVETLRVKEGSVVMLNCNLDLKSRLANGTMGTVVHCTKDVITVHFPEVGLYGVQRELWITKKGKTERFYQFPLCPATAVTIHKSQGVTVDGVIIITEGMFGNGSFYTAISRARELKLCRITRFDPNLVQVSEASKNELERMRNEKIIRFEFN